MDYINLNTCVNNFGETFNLEIYDYQMVNEGMLITFLIENIMYKIMKDF